MFFTRTPRSEQVLCIFPSRLRTELMLVDFTGSPKIISHLSLARKDRPGHEAVHTRDLAQAAGKLALTVHPTSIALIFGYPDTLLQARHLKKQFPEQTVITEGFFDELLRRDRQAIEDDVLARHPSGLDLLSRTLAHIRVNGYETRALFGKKAKTVEVDITAAYIDRAAYARYTQLCAEYFPGISVTFFSREQLAGKVVSARGDGLVCTLEEEYTSLVLVQKGLIAESVAVPFGVSLFEDSLVRALGISHGEYESLISLRARGDLGPEAARRLAGALERALRHFSHELAREWEPIKKTRHIPKELFCAVSERLLGLLVPAELGRVLRESLRSEGDFSLIMLDEARAPVLPGPDSVRARERYLISALAEVMHADTKEN